MSSGTEERYCPICEEQMYESLCPTDGVKTIPASALKSASACLVPGTVIGNSYRVEGILGSGAMGSVYAATQLTMDRRVALKILVREMLRDGTELRRFFLEARSASRLRHPNIVQIYEFGVDEVTQTPFIAMELVEGRTLRRLIAEEAPIALRRSAHILQQVARALVTAHDAGLIHRDLKPDNIMVGVLPGDDEHVTVLDFGIAKSVRTPGGLQESLTASGVVVGTPRYMSPEQVRGHSIDARSDLYSMGCIFHEMLTGRPPFEADDAVGLMHKHVNAVRPSLSELDADPASASAARILQSLLLAQTPESRPSTAAHVATVFKQIALGQPPADVVTALTATDGSSGVDGFGSSSDGGVAGSAHSTGDTDTYVKKRPDGTPTPIDSRAFASQELSRLEPATEPGASGPSRRRIATVLSGLGVAALLGLWFALGPTEEAGTAAAPSDFDSAEPATDSAAGGERTPADDAPAGDDSERAVEAAAAGTEDPASAGLLTPAGDAGAGPDTPTLGGSSSAAEAPPAEAPPAHPETVTVRVTGTPAGAIVRDARGRRLGRVPTSIELPWSDTPVRLSVQKKGYNGRPYRITPDRDRRLRVRLPLELAPRVR